MSNESMANQITDVPSAIAELLAVNKQLEQELQKTRERLEFAESALLKIKRRPFDDKTHIRMIEDQKKFINEILNISYEYFRVKLQDANSKGISVPAMFKQEKDKQGE